MKNFSDWPIVAVNRGKRFMQHIRYSMMSLCMIVKLVELVDLIEMRKTDCFGKTRLVLHVPSSS